MIYPTKKLGEIAAVDWGNASITKASYKPDGYLAVSATGPDGFMDSFEHDQPAIILSAIGAKCGKTFWVNGKWTAVKNTITIFSSDEKICSTKYLYYFLTPNKWKIVGGGQPFITKGAAESVKIPLPPLIIQKQIVERLDKIAEAQKLNNELVQKTGELFQSLLHRELKPASKDWEVKQLAEAADFLDNLRKPVTASDRVPGPYPYYGANGQQDSVGGYIFDDELVLLAEDGGYFGSKTRPVAYRVSGKCWINNHAHVLKNKKEISNIDFLGYSLMYYDVTPYITGSTRAKLNKSAAGKIKISLPSLKTQKQIVAKLSAVQDYKKQLIGQKAKLKDLFDSALHKLMGNNF